MQTPTKITAMVIPTTVAFPAKLLVGPSKYQSKYKRKKIKQLGRLVVKKQTNCLLLKYYLFRTFLNIILYYIVYTLYGTSAPLGCIMLVNGVPPLPARRHPSPKNTHKYTFRTFLMKTVYGELSEFEVEVVSRAMPIRPRSARNPYPGTQKF